MYSVAMTQSRLSNKITHKARLTHGITAMLLILLCSLSAAQDGDDLPFLDLNTPIRLNFSGNWQKDFGRSDSWEDELNRMMRIRQEQAAAQRSGAGSLRSGPAVSVGNINLNRSRGASIVDLARLAEYISRQSTMQIIQDRNEVRIERKGEAPLICGLKAGAIETFSSIHGTEICGWDRQQLVFEISLPEALTITHRFSVSSDSSVLQMVTSISSRDSAPFNLIQAFDRFDAPPQQYNCIQTISRGRVCSQTTPLD
jgi:hypothetical protein